MIKFTINNNTEISDLRCLDIISKIIGMGKVSGNKDCYCYVTSFKVNGDTKNYLATAERQKSDLILISTIRRRHDSKGRV